MLFSVYVQKLKPNKELQLGLNHSYSPLPYGQVPVWAQWWQKSFRVALTAALIPNRSKTLGRALVCVFRFWVLRLTVIFRLLLLGIFIQTFSACCWFTQIAHTDHIYQLPECFEFLIKKILLISINNNHAVSCQMSNTSKIFVEKQTSNVTLLKLNALERENNIIGILGRLNFFKKIQLVDINLTDKNKFFLCVIHFSDVRRPFVPYDFDRQ